MKLLKKSLSLILALCMIMTCVPMNVFAAENEGTDDQFYKIVHLDAGRKYFTEDQIQDLIDVMAQNGMNQLQLYLADNQGFRLALEDMNVTYKDASGADVTVDLTPALGDGYMQDSQMSANDNFFQPSGEGYLTHEEMARLVVYARNRGIEIVPCINVPGHMGAILNPYRIDDDVAPEQDPFANLRYNGSLSSIDLTNPDAVSFALALTQKYVEFFASLGCEYYSIGADEYIYDTGVGSLNGLSPELKTGFVDFMKRAAGIIQDAGMTPRAFNDAFGLTTDWGNAKFEVYHWDTNTTGVTPDEVAVGGHTLINTSRGIYWALGSTAFPESTVNDRLSGFNSSIFDAGETLTEGEPVGACFAIWCDRALSQSATQVISSAGRYINTYAMALNGASSDGSADGGTIDPGTSEPDFDAGENGISLYVDETSSESYQVEGKFETVDALNQQLFGTTNPTYVTVKDIQTTDAVYAGEWQNGCTNNRMWSWSDGDVVYISEGTNFLVLNDDGTSFTSRYRPDSASPAGTEWTIVKRDESSFAIKSGAKYLTIDGNNNLAVTETLSDNCYWQLEVTQEGYYPIKHVTGRYIRFYEDASNNNYTPNWQTVENEPLGLQNIGFYPKDTPATTTFRVGAKAVTGTENPVTFTDINNTTHKVYVLERSAVATVERVINMSVGETSGEFTVIGTYLETMPAFNPTGFVSGEIVDAAEGQEASYGTEKVTALADNMKVIIGDGSNFLKLNVSGETATLTTTNDRELATVWTAVVGWGNFFFQENNGFYLLCPGYDKFESGHHAPVISKSNNNGETGASAWNLNETSYSIQYFEPSYASAIVTSAGKVEIVKDNSKGNTYAYEVSEYIPTSTTVTFTAEAVGQTEVTVGNVKFIINVTQNSIEGNETINCVHDLTEYPANCTNPARCSICGEKVGDPDPNVHDGFTIPANCQSRAKCALCGTADPNGRPGGHVYSVPATCISHDKCVFCGIEEPPTLGGALNPNKHAGETRVDGYLAPTTDAAGYTGDLVCMDCDETIIEGSVIPKLSESGGTTDPSEPKYDAVLNIPVGTTVTVVDQEEDATFDATGMDTSVATIYRNRREEDKGGIDTDAMTALAAGKKVIIGNGTYFLQLDVSGTTPQINVVKDKAAATVWSVSNGWFRFIYNGYYLGFPYGGAYDIAIGTSDGTGRPFELTADTNALKDYDANINRSVYISESGVTVQDNINGNAYVYEVTEASSANTTITVTGNKVDVTYATIGGVKYKINVYDPNAVVPEDPTALNLYRWITNFYAVDVGVNDYSAANQIVKISSTDDSRLVNIFGMKLTDLVENEASIETNTASQGVFWKGIVHTADQKQAHSGASDSIDKSRMGVEFNYLRYYEQKWQYSTDRINWTDVGENTLDVYYLQETQVTQEVITEVVDWGFDYSATDGTSGTSGYDKHYVLLDFAVYVDGVGRHPNMTAYPNAGVADPNLANQKTIVFHSLTDEEKVITTDEGGVLRRVDTIYAAETEDYEVYMITVTRTSDNFNVKLPEQYPSTFAAGNQYKYVDIVDGVDQAGKEQIIWTIDSETYRNMVGRTTVDGKIIYGDLSIMPEDFNPESDKGYENMYRTVGGEPLVHYVQIYQRQGLLVTYYVRAKTTEGSLKVHYRLEGSDQDFYTYNIAVPELDDYFDDNFTFDTSSPTGLKHNTVFNKYGYLSTVTTDLTTLMGVPSAYRTGSYHFTNHVELIKDNTTVQIPDNEHGECTHDHHTHSDECETNCTLGSYENAIEEVILYYTMDNVHYVPVDFGNPVKIDGSFFVHKIEGGTVTSVSAGSANLKYGELSGVNNVYYYTPKTVIHGVENPVVFNITVEVNEKGTLVPHDESHVVIFLPATTVYYEEAFADFTAGTASWMQTGSMPRDAQEAHCAGQNGANYGYDAIFTQKIAAMPSNTYAESKEMNALAEFTFIGDGFEVFAYCSTNTSVARVALFKVAEDGGLNLHKMYIVDTKMANGTDNQITGDQAVHAYNIPIVSELGLEYGKYTVRLGYMNSNATAEDRPDNFRFDGFRVFNTLQADDLVYELKNETAQSVYTKDNESGAVFMELRDSVLATAAITDKTAKSAYQLGNNIVDQVFDAGSPAVPNAMILSIVDETKTNLVNDNVKVDLLDNGPKNEIYLGMNEALVFNVYPGYMIQVGMKALSNSGNEAKVRINGTKDVQLTNYMDMFYEVEANDDGTVLIQNITGHTISITKLKLIPVTATEPTIYGLRSLSARSLASALVFMGYDDTPIVEEPVVKNGLITDEDGEIRFYENDVAIYAGLVQDDEGNYYYINSAKKAVKDCVYGIGAAKTNDLLPAGIYNFGADGKMIDPPTAEPDEPDTEIKQGLVVDADGEIRYYVDGVATYAGLVQDDEGNYYYINSSKKAVKDCAYGIGAAKTNDLLPAGVYNFGADGKMINPPTAEPDEPDIEVKQGLVVDEDGEIRYYVDGVATYAGLVQDDEGNYYYINSSKKAVKDCIYGIGAAKTNGLLDAGKYQFGADGKMILN